MSNQPKRPGVSHNTNATQAEKDAWLQRGSNDGGAVMSRAVYGAAYGIPGEPLGGDAPTVLGGASPNTATYGNKTVLGG